MPMDEGDDLGVRILSIIAGALSDSSAKVW